MTDPHESFSYIHQEKPLGVWKSRKKETEIGSLHVLKTFLTHDLQIYRNIAIWNTLMVHIIAYLKQPNIFVSHEQYDGKPIPLLLEILSFSIKTSEWSPKIA